MGKEFFETANLQQVVESLESAGEEAVVELNKKLRAALMPIHGNADMGAMKASIYFYKAYLLLATFINKHTGHRITIEPDGDFEKLYSPVNTAIAKIRRSVDERKVAQTKEQAREEIAELVELAGSNSDIPFGYTRLNESDRTRIFSAIEKIRALVDQSDLSPRKKDAVLKKLSELHQEVARENTRTERIFGFLLDLSFVSGEMAKRAKPAIDEAKEMARIVMYRRSEQEGIALPSEDELPRLPSPRNEDKGGD